MNKSFTDFIKHSHSQREISLAVAKDDHELRQFEHQLDEAGYKKAHDTNELLHNMHKNTQIYLLIEENFPKALYDLIIQYPTGQVEIFDVHSMKSTVISPEYEKSSIILLATKEDLSFFEQKGYSILQHVGMAFQS